MTSQGGLRERKKLAAMQRIQSIALDLFDELGYDNVTIEQIAAAAEVSPSSVYRYFRTKEQVVLWDQGDIEFVEALAVEMLGHPPIEAVRSAMAQVFNRYFQTNEERAKRLTNLLFAEPALRSAQLEQVNGFTTIVTRALAQASGRQETELEVQVVATVLVGSLMVAARHWYDSGYATSLQDEMERALRVVENGLTLT
ncbi:MAG TPA: TetR family transcriptional regulator [Dehalococcoidia bacterium]